MLFCAVYQPMITVPQDSRRSILRTPQRAGVIHRRYDLDGGFGPLDGRVVRRLKLICRDGVDLP